MADLSILAAGFGQVGMTLFGTITLAKDVCPVQAVSDVRARLPAVPPRRRRVGVPREGGLLHGGDEAERDCVKASAE